MNMYLQNTLVGLVAIVLAGLIWIPCLHFFYAGRGSGFKCADGLSVQAKSLAKRQLEMWTDPALRDFELRKMRASNAEWDFMGRSFLVWSLANMGLRDPASKSLYLETIDRILDETLRLEQEHGMYFFLMPYAKWRKYVVRPEHSLFLDGEIALMLASRRMLEEKPEFKPLLTARVDAISNRLRLSSNLVLESYPNECWMFDHVVALAAMRMADKLDGSDHSELIRDWLAMARQTLVHRESGLLISSFTTDLDALDGPEGSTIWMVAHCLQLLDEDFARDQYARARKELSRTTVGFSYCREWPKSWTGQADVDSGPIFPVFNISAGASGMAFIGASAFQDRRFLSSLATTLEFAAFPSRKDGGLKYCASNQVGDAALLYAASLGPLWDKVKTVGAGNHTPAPTLLNESAK